MVILRKLKLYQNELKVRKTGRNWKHLDNTEEYIKLNQNKFI